MRNVSQAFLDAIPGSHEPFAEALVLRSGEAPVPIDVLSGAVILDSSASRGRLDLNVPATLEPTEPTDLLAPYGNELLIRRGIRLANGAEWADLGVFGIEDSSADDAPDGELRVTGLDRSKRVIRAAFEAAVTIAGGTDYLTAILDVVRGGYPDVEHDFASRTLETPLLIADKSDDRWDFVRGMAEALGMELYFDGAGTLILRVVPSPVDDAIYEIAEGDGGVLLKRGTNLSREDAHNIFDWTGENPDNEGEPPTAKAEDLNPNSPTYVGSQFGRVPTFETSAFIATTDQAAAAAQGQMAKELGTSKKLEFQAIVNPALEPGDVVRVVRDGTIENHILDSVTIPLTASEGMTAQSRAVTVQ